MIARTVAAAVARSNIIMAELVRCANAGLPCPTNVTLTEMLGVVSPDTIASAFRRLEDRGLISVKRHINSRIVTIVGTGRSTAPGVAPGKRNHADGAAGADDKAQPVRVDRNPCTYCGVRGDIGCRHSHAAARAYAAVPFPSHVTGVAQP